MVQLQVHHTVEDYPRWKRAFDEHSPTRIAQGCKGYRLLQRSGNPNDIFIVFEWDTVENAEAFSTSEDLNTVMDKAGVTSIPEVNYLEEIELSFEGTEEDRPRRTA